MGKESAHGYFRGYQDWHFSHLRSTEVYKISSITEYVDGENSSQAM